MNINEDEFRSILESNGWRSESSKGLSSVIAILDRIQSVNSKIANLKRQAETVLLKLNEDIKEIQDKCNHHMVFENRQTAEDNPMEYCIICGKFK